MNTDKIFANFLYEMSGPIRKLFHYTNTIALAGILKDGAIKLGNYDINLETEKKIHQGRNEPLRVAELATVRPTMSHFIYRDGLSNNMGFIKIIIKPHILSDKVRGIKVKPIAEFPLFAINTIRDEFIKIGNKKQLATVNANRVLAAFKKIVDDPKLDQQNEKQDEEFKKWLRESFTIELPVRTFIDAGDNMMAYIKAREGEERISLKKGDRIPLNQNYISIELMSGFTQDFQEGYIEKVDFEGQEILEVAQWNRWMDKYPELFEKNDEYFKFRNKLKSLKREFGSRVISVSSKTKKVIKPIVKAKGPRVEKKIIMPKLKDL
jgi:hypothetical protein